MSPQRVWRSFRRGPLAGRLLFPVVCLLIWVLSIKLVTSIWPFAVDVLPTPWQVIKFMWNEITLKTVAPHNLYETFAISLQRLAIGMVIALIIGTVIGIAMGLSKAVNAFFNDWIVAILAMPNLAWALFCSLAFGFGDTRADHHRRADRRAVRHHQRARGRAQHAERPVRHGTGVRRAPATRHPARC